MAKLAPGDLAQVLGKLPKQNAENVIVGFDNADDAGVFRFSEELALVQTLDFFTPVADDPYTYGQIAAVNSLNDVYAMGGTPLTALSIVCFPQKGDWEVLGQILAGGQAMMNSENVVVLGGHSVDDQEIKFGYSVTGTVAPNRVTKNSGAQPGDVLVLTKPIGTGVINTAVKAGTVSPSTEQAALGAMMTSARLASSVMIELGAHGCTDVTGFGLLGHAFEMAKASGVTLTIESKSIPLLPDVIELIRAKMLTRGDRNNRIYVGDTVKINDNVSGEMQSALFDPQTAGGLLISMTEEVSREYLNRVPDSAVIGRVDAFSEKLINVC